MRRPTASVLRRPTPLIVSALVAASSLALSATPASASVAGLPDATAGANGTVVAVLESGGRIYIGGTFSWVGPRTGNGIATGAADGLRTASLARLNGPAYAAAADGKGGWYIGGAFTQASGRVRGGAARVTPTGALASTWDPNVAGTVQAIAVVGSTVYLGGSFTSVGGAARDNLAAVDASTGAVLPWNPGTTGPVYSLASSQDGAVVYAGGSFSTAGGVSRSNLAAIDASSGNALSWDPGANGTVEAIAVSGSTVYAGGSFSTAGGVSRSNLAAIDASSGAPLAWDPAPDGAVHTLSLSGSTLYVGGAFSWIGGQERPRAATLDVATAAVGPWNPRLDADVHAVARSGLRVYVGGDFSMGNGAPRSNVAAIDAATGEVDLGWRSDADAEVRGIATSEDGSTIYLGGVFSSIEGAGRRRLAAVDAATGDLTAWNPKASAAVRALVVEGDRVWAGGSFTSVGSEARPYLAAIDAATGAVDLGFSPDPDGTVRALALSPDGSTLYAGGFYSHIGGAQRDGAAALDPATGQATSFDPGQIGSGVIAVAVSPDGSRFYLSTTGNKTSQYAPASGDEPLWSIKSGGDVQAIAASTTEVYVGGHFSKLAQNMHRGRIGSLDAASGAVTSWNPGVDSFWGVWALQVTDDSLLVGGDFTRVAGRLQPHFARFSGTP